MAMASRGVGPGQGGANAAAGVAAAVSGRTGVLVETLSIEERADARRAAELIADSHRGYFSAFNSLTAEAQEDLRKACVDPGRDECGAPGPPLPGGCGRYLA